ncbi:hypothetical protein BSK66_24760 [Paenibacillus odorifer]|uniref:Hachiman antiphage defense system protein HamA n=1 Tax=Paenibacillus TaxID=44249 RepID=UPI0003E1C54C|nr:MULTISPECIES: Hachiman antiphage defense system protein HamA [Paenibacillus]ETT61796.1 hypothetical protein C171_11751 [Paenibacillus sp. FSL H8-237]OME50681.1 hypothetical protein BSK66_24760 [Paenibacillus odorifer]SIR49465.1 protein of unknown function [Paenibacillus sp. RU4X]SIR58596.1 protein of unknown function [Paenibacillus sp. RU4T]
MPIINNYPSENHPFSMSLTCSNENATNGVPHRCLIENGHHDVFLDHMTVALQNHHISPEALERRRDLIESLRIIGAPMPLSPHPRNLSTQKGNFAEVFLAEYLCETTGAELPIYRLRYNPNIEQSMKGDDVLLFDLDSDPVRIIVGESKFRGVPDKQAVVDIVDGLVRSNKAGLPISLMFVAERLFEAGNSELAKKVQNCAILFVTNQLQIHYVGLLMSNHNTRRIVNTHASSELHNLLIISLNFESPETIVQQAFARLENNI